MTDCQATCDACRLLEVDGQWRVQLHTVEDSLERLQPEWDRLLPASGIPAFFIQNAWQRLWWRHFGDDFSLRLITVREGSGRLAGIAPLMVSRREPEGSLQFIGGTEVADYLDLIVDGLNSPRARAVLLEAVRRHLPWHSLDLRDLPADSATLGAAQAAFDGPGLRVEQAQENVCPTVALGGSWEAYLAGLNKKDRHELRRKLRRAVDDQGAIWRTVQAAEDLQAALEAFLDLLRRSSPLKGAFMTPAMESYFRDLALLAFQQGWLRLGVLWAGDVPVSSALGFAYGDRLYLYNSGYDPAYAAHSVGIAAVGLLLRDAAEEGLAVFDFLQGNEPYKYTLGGRDQPIYRVLVTREGYLKDER